MEAVLSAAQDFSMILGDSSQVSAVRLAAQRMAQNLGMDATRVGEVAIAVTEAATNVLRHGGGGTFAARGVSRGGVLGMELLAVDDGPGMKSFAASSVDGVSSRGSAGTGLGAIQRLADEFDVYTRPDLGTLLRIVFWSGEKPPVHSRYEVGTISIPCTGETLCGDNSETVCDAAGVTVMVADGLGHGPDAAYASGGAVEALRRNPGKRPIDLLDVAHGRLRATRGAALAVMRHDAGSDEIAFAGVGNIAACILDGEQKRMMVSHNGIVGHNVHRSEEYRYPWPPGALLVAHSDGLESHWDLGAFPGIGMAHPSLIAAMLYREHWRKRDDVVVVVVRQRSQQ
jgi:anti-sigma regulatory factor (Ser/Thr protein kinase)